MDRLSTQTQIQPQQRFQQLKLPFLRMTDKLPPPAPGAEHLSWWDEAFLPVPRTEHPKLRSTMLYLIAYDIAKPKRLSKVAKACENFGARVQYSLFECRLNPDHFDILWNQLLDLIDSSEDRIVAYRLDTDNASRTLTAGTMEVTTPVLCYLV